MTRNFDRSGVPMRRVAFALAAVLALNPGVSLAGAGASNDAGAAAVPGALVIQSEPAGANVYLDGRLAGLTPLQVGSLTPGDHRVRVVKDGYLENARIVSVGATPKNVHVKLTPHTGTSNASAEQVSGGAAAVADRRNGCGSDLREEAPPRRRSFWPTEMPRPMAGTVAVNPSTGLAASTAITFTAQGASDPDGDDLTFTWNFGDGSSGTGSPVTKTYANAGTFNVTVDVSDGKKSASAAGSVTIRNMTGNWVGTITQGTFTVPFAMILTQTGAAVSGTYSDSFGPGTISGTVSPGNAVRLVGKSARFPADHIPGNGGCCREQRERYGPDRVHRRDTEVHDATLAHWLPATHGGVLAPRDAAPLFRPPNRFRRTRPDRRQPQPPDRLIIASRPCSREGTKVEETPSWPLHDRSSSHCWP